MEPNKSSGMVMTKSKVRSTAQAFWIAMFAAALAACSLDFEKQAIVLESDGDGSITADGQSDLEDGKDQADDLTTDLTIDSVDTPDVTGDFADLTDTADLIPDQDATEVLDATDVAADTEADGTVVANPCAWSDATDLGGLDWTVGDGEVISGRYVGIDHFEVPAGVTAAVGALGNDLSGKVELCARIITIDGEINAAGAGPPGGVGGALNHAAEPGLGVAPGVGGQTGDAANATCRPYDSTPHQRGGPGELGAGAYYSVPADISTDDEVWIGSGGGGGGRGGKGGAATCCQRTAAGGGGGNGGAGGPGGGAVVLVATESLTVNGVIKTSGQSGTSGSAGAAGSSSNPAFSSCGAACGSSCPGYDSRYALCDSACTEQECCRLYRGGTGGAGGAGGAGSAGGILLQAPALTLSVISTIEALGGDQDTAHGGTVKLRYRGAGPGLSTIKAARVQEAPLLP